MQFKVPQNIQMEDKIIGPLTMKQFVYLLVGGMVTYATIKSYNTTMFLFVGLPVGILALCLAFIKIQDQPFSKFILSLVSYLLKPKQRVWQKDRIVYATSSPIVQEKVGKDKKQFAPKEVEKSELEKLSYILDTRGHEQAIEEQKLVGAPEINIKDFKKPEKTVSASKNPAPQTATNKDNIKNNK